MSVRVFRPFPHPSSFPVYPFSGLQGTKFLKAPDSHLSHPWRRLLTLPPPFPKALELGKGLPLPDFQDPFLVPPCPFLSVLNPGKTIFQALKLKMWGLCLRSLVPRDPPITSPL